MFSTDFIFRQQENLVDNQKCQAGFKPLCNKILMIYFSTSNLRSGLQYSSKNVLNNKNILKLFISMTVLMFERFGNASLFIAKTRREHVRLTG